MGDREDLEAIIAHSEKKPGLGSKLINAAVRIQRPLEVAGGILLGYLTYKGFKAYNDFRPIQFNPAFTFFAGAYWGYFGTKLVLDSLEVLDFIKFSMRDAHRHFKELKAKLSRKFQAGFLQKTIDTVLEHPLVVSLATIAAIFRNKIAFTLQYDILHNPLPKYYKHVLSSDAEFIKANSLLNTPDLLMLGAMTLVGWACVNLANYTLNPKNIGLAKKSLQINFTRLLKDKEEEIRIYEEPTTKSLELVSKRALAPLYLRQGEFDKAIDAYKYIINSVNTTAFRNTFFLYFLQLGTGYKRIVRQLKKNPSDPTKYLGPAVLLAEYSKRKSLLLWEKACSMPGEHRAEINALCGYSLAINEYPTEVVNDRFKQLLSMLDTSLFKVVGEHRNEVLEYTGTDFFKSTFRFKRNRRNEYAQEFRLSSYFRGILGERSVQPLAYFHESGYNYIVSRFIGSRNLQQVLSTASEQGKIRLLKEALAGLSTIHMKSLQAKAELGLEDAIARASYVNRYGARFPNSDAAGHSSYFQNRLDDVLFGQVEEHSIKLPLSLKNDILNCTWFIADRLADIKVRPYYKDANPTNLVQDEGGNLVQIDFEGNKLLPYQLDLISLLEFTPEGTLSPNSKTELVCFYMLHNIMNSTDDNKRITEIRNFLQISDKHKQELVRSSEFFNLVGISRDEWIKRTMADYEAAGMQRHLEMAGYKMRDKSRDSNWVKTMKHHQSRLTEIIGGYIKRPGIPQGDITQATQLLELQQTLYGYLLP